MAATSIRRSSPLRARLGLDDLVVAAEALVDRSGWDALSMTALAAEVGIRPPSLYNHVESLDALRAILQVRTIRRLGAQLRTAAMGRSGPDGLRALVEVHRSFALRWPHRYEGVTRAPLDRDAFITASLDAHEALEAMVLSYGHSPMAALDVELAIFSAVHGFVALEVRGFFGDEVDMDRLFALVVDGVTRAVVALPEPTTSMTAKKGLTKKGPARNSGAAAKRGARATRPRVLPEGPSLRSQR